MQQLLRKFSLTTLLQEATSFPHSLYVGSSIGLGSISLNPKDQTQLAFHLRNSGGCGAISLLTKKLTHFFIPHLFGKQKFFFKYK